MSESVPAANPSEPRPLLVQARFTARTYDVDFMGIVSNIVHVRWLEDLRLRLLEEYLPLDEQLTAGYAPILARTEITYKQPVRLGETVGGQLWVSDLGRLRWTVTAELHVGRHLAAAAVQSGAFFDLHAQQPIPMPEPLVRAYREWPRD
ncbi:MAG: thioesterase family protein [Candidatus Krumholzibacteriia bacterium]